MVKQSLYNELIEGFIYREYNDLFGPLQFSKEKAYEFYRNDVRFHNRVRQVVGDICQIVEKHIPEAIE